MTTPHIPGLELHLPPGTIIRDKDGELVTEIKASPPDSGRSTAPSLCPFGAEFPMYYTVQPGGAYIEPLWRPNNLCIILNVNTNEPPGTRIKFWNYDAGEKGMAHLWKRDRHPGRNASCAR